MPRSEQKNGAREKKAKSYAVKEYLSDIHKNSMLYGALVRSPNPSGKITNIDAGMIPEEYTLYTAREIPASNTLKTFTTETQVFCTDRVHYRGEPVGILVGPDIKSTRRWAKEVHVNLDFSAFSQNDSDGTQKKQVMAARTVRKGFFEGLEEDLKNQAFQKKALGSGKKTDETEGSFSRNGEKQNAEKLREQKVSEFFRGFKYDFENVWTYRETSPYWTETSGAFVCTESGSLNVYSPTQWPLHLEKGVSDVLGLSEDKIEIRKTQTQCRNTNGAWRAAMLSCQAAVASYLSGKPVKLLLTHDEQDVFMKNGLETTIKLRTALSEDGKIQALRASITADAGHQNPFAQEIADRLTVAIVNMYSPEHMEIETEILSSALPPTSISAEKLDTAAYFAVESQINLISRKTGMLPDEIKAQNIQKEGSIFTFKGLKWQEAVNAIVRQSDFKRRYSSFNLTSTTPMDDGEHIFFSLPRRGIGLASGLDGAFFLGSTFENHQQKMELTLGYDGKLVIKAPIPSLSISDIWKEIASELLGIEQADIQINTDTETMMQSPLPEGFSSNISIMTSLLRKCCLEIQKKRFKVPLPITAKKATSRVIKKAFDSEKFRGSPFYSTAFGSAVMELEMNPYTYKITIKGIWVAIDCGEILSMKAAENTVRLAIRQELEGLVEDENLSSESTSIAFVQSQNPPCQLGSLIHNLIPGAFAAALSQAIGTAVTRIPCTAEQLFEYTQKAKEEAERLLEEEKHRTREETHSAEKELQVGNDRIKPSEKEIRPGEKDIQQPEKELQPADDELSKDGVKEEK